MKSPERLMRSAYRAILDLVLPERCLGCGTSGAALCDACISRVRSAERETDTSIFACFDYRDPLIQKAIWNLKYYNRKSLGSRLGILLYQTMLEEIADMESYRGADAICVVPVPLSRHRTKTRGYNQAAIIARHFCAAAPSGMFELKRDIIRKKADTIAQAKLSNRAARLRNIRGAFEVRDPASVRGRTYIIIDDVTTTGGTILEMMKVLKSAGARKVVGFAIAH
jgi:ComF family protein